jgi:hypothetical protein
LPETLATGRCPGVFAATVFAATVFFAGALLAAVFLADAAVRDAGFDAAFLATDPAAGFFAVDVFRAFPAAFATPVDRTDFFATVLAVVLAVVLVPFFAGIAVFVAGLSSLPVLAFFAGTCRAAGFAASFAATGFRVDDLAVPPAFTGIRALAMLPPVPRGPCRNAGLDSTPDLQAG